jgi:hypothetical protein
LKARIIIPRRPKPSPVFGSYWRFASERQAVFLRRIRGEQPPWTDDPIIANYKFTNAFRVSDRESQFLIREVIGKEKRNHADTFFRIILFRLFNKSETWNLLTKRFGDLTLESFDLPRFDRSLTEAIDSGTTLFSAAYIMPSRGAGLTAPRKHSNLLLVLRRMLDDEVPERIFESGGPSAYRTLRSYPMIGDFLAYQYLTDLGYSPNASFEEHEFVAPGPGARDGLRKCFSDSGGLSDADLIRWVCDNQEQLAELCGLEPPTLFGRRLQLIDCQNLFCEVDKYARVAHPEVSGVSGRTRIKQKYEASPSRRLPRQEYPMRWGLNDAVKAFYRRGDGLRNVPAVHSEHIAAGQKP